MPHFLHLEKEKYTDFYCKSAMETGKLNFGGLYSTAYDEGQTNTCYK